MNDPQRKGSVLHVLPSQQGPASHWILDHIQRVEPELGLDQILSLDRIQELFQLGSIYLNKKRCFHEPLVDQGDYLRVHYQPRRYPRPDHLLNRVQKEDEYFWIIDKPSGVPCHPTVDNAQDNLLSWLAQETGIDAKITHRLDIGTSGLLVVAKSPLAASAFNKVLLKQGVEKIYEAYVEGHMNFDQYPTLITHFMDDELWAPRHVHLEKAENRLECRLQVLESEIKNGVPTSTWLKLRLETGRTHQIRAQMGALGHPICSDQMYGASFACSKDRWALRCTELRFRHPFRYDEFWDFRSPSEFGQQNNTPIPRFEFEHFAHSPMTLATSKI